MISTLLFVFSTALVVSMIFYRVWEIRAGRFNLEEIASRELTMPHVHIEKFNNKFLELLRQFAHIVLVLTVRATIGILYIIRRESKRLSTKLDHFFLHNNGPADKGSVSFFLRDIAEYKNKIKGALPDKKEE